MNIPNIITASRISLIPIFVLVFYLPWQFHYLASAIIFGIAAITDWLDGYLARKLKQTSSLGEFLDPVADKLLIVVALVLLVEHYATPYIALPAAVIVGREIVISALREWMAELGKRAHVSVSFLGKLKTVSQMVAIIFLLARKPDLDDIWVRLGYILLYISAILTLWSMVIYLRAAWTDLSKS